MDCGYRFKADAEKVKSCPYCAGSSIEKEKSAEELVEDAKIE
jgi:predicted Zn-ribbon and HTH transcriptional regulator